MRSLICPGLALTCSLPCPYSMRPPAVSTRSSARVVLAPRTNGKRTQNASTERFDDLLEGHERRHGPLRKLALPSQQQQSSPNDVDEEQKLEPPSSVSARREGTSATGATSAVIPGGREGDVLWRSTPEERQLYSRIARRVEEALLQLEVEARRDLGEDYPGRPPEPAAMIAAKEA